MNAPFTTSRQDAASRPHATDRLEASERPVQAGHGPNGDAANPPGKWRFSQRLVSVVLMGCALLPPIILAWAVWQYAVNIPSLDEWQLAGLFQKLGRGSLRLTDLFAQQNEYRQFFPNVIIVFLGWVTHWDPRVDIALSVLLSGFVAWGVWRIGRKSLPAVSRHWLLNPTLLLATNLLIFSLTQWQNWLMGEQIEYFIPAACLVGGLLAASSEFSVGAKVTICMGLCTISSFSSPNGFICWLLLVPRRSLISKGEKLKARWLVAWLAVAGAELALYLHDYHTPPRHPSVLTALQQPLEATAYFLAFLGSALVPFASFLTQQLPVAIAAGALLMLAFAFACYFIFRRSGETRRELHRRAVPWLTLGAYSILSAGMVMAGRVGFGASQALSSRYIAFSLYLIIAVIWLGVILLSYHERRDQAAEGPQGQKSGRLVTPFVVTVSVALVALSITTFAPSIWHMERSRRGLLYEKSCILLINYLPSRTVEGLADRWGLRNVVQTINELNRLDLLRPHLTKDRDILKSAPNGDVAEARYGYVDEFELTPGGELFVRGWAVLPDRRRPADAIAFTYRDSLGRYVVFDVIRVGLKRPDVEQLLKSSAFQASGWSEKLKPLKGWPETVQFDTWAIDATSRKAYRLMDPQIINFTPADPPVVASPQARPN